MTDNDKRRIERINEISGLGRSSWIGLLAYLAFIFVTLLGVEDADFFVPSRQTQLPLVGVEIPTKSFFYFAPVLGAALYVYLHLFLIKLWDAIGEAPAKVRTHPVKNQGILLSEVIHPWLVNDMATRWKKDAHPKRPLGWLSTLVTLFLVWVSGPAILGFFWWWSMPAHDEWLTLLAGFCFFLSLATGSASFFRAREKLEGWSPPGFELVLRRGLAMILLLLVFALSWVRTEGGLEHWAAWTVRQVNMVTNGRYLLVCEDRATEHGQIQGPLRADCFDRHGLRLPEEMILDRAVARHVITTDAFEFGAEDWPFSIWLEGGDTWSALARTGLSEQELVPLPEDWRDHDTARREFREVWCRREALPMAVCDHLADQDRPAPSHLTMLRENWCEANPDPEGRTCPARFKNFNERFVTEWKVERAAHLANLPTLDLGGADLRSAETLRASLVNATLTKARMEGATLGGARMEGADLNGARMERADLSGARMEGADLRGARMEGANLSGVRMEGAALQEARMIGTDLKGVRMEGADLSGARMEGADLRDAQMMGAILNGAWMAGAKLRGARMEGVNLGGADMERTDLSRVWMKGANLFGVRMQEALLWDAQMEGAVLSQARMQGADFRGTSFKSADWAGAILGSPAQSADFRGAQNFGQKQLDQMIGDEWTLLPEGSDPETGEPWSIPSCWELPPPWFDGMVRRMARWLFEYRSEQDIREDYLCGRRPAFRYSNRLPVNAPYPEGHPLAKRD